MSATNIDLALPTSLVVNLACAPTALPQPWLTVSVSGTPLPPKPTTTSTVPAEVLGTQTVSPTGSLPFTGTDGRALAIQILGGLLLIQIGYLLWSATTPKLAAPSGIQLTGSARGVMPRGSIPQSEQV